MRTAKKHKNAKTRRYDDHDGNSQGGRRGIERTEQRVTNNEQLVTRLQVAGDRVQGTGYRGQEMGDKLQHYNL